METTSNGKASYETFGTAHVPPKDTTDVDDLAHELKSLLVRHENVLNEEGIRQEVEVLERWMESYRNGLRAARKISETGTGLLEDLRNHLKLAIEERHRLEGEGGSASSKDETQKIDDLMKTVRRIEKVLPNIEQVFHAKESELETADA